jgi:predicted enzyme related to lactoylglutathione lyase
MKMTVGVLDHYNVSTRKLEETVHFYENVLGSSTGHGLSLSASLCVAVLGT